MSGKILIVDDVATNRIVLKVKLANAKYEVLQAASGKEALDITRSHQPDLILLDLQLPDCAGIDLITTLRANPATAFIPIVVVSVFQDPQSRLNALRAGAEDFMVKPLDELSLLARLRSLLRARETDQELRLRETTTRDLGLDDIPEVKAPTPRIALIAGDSAVVVGWKTALTKALPNAILSILSRDDALSKSDNETTPDAFIIAADLGRPGEGLRLMSELRSRADTRHSVILIALPECLCETAAVALDLGANDLVRSEMRNPEVAQEVAIRLTAQIARKRTLDRQRATLVNGLRLATIDPLTGLYNRRYALPHLRRITERAHETGRLFAVILIDIDRFKAVNDTYGHSAGDRVLAEVANRLTLNMREVDMIARIGGEEFLVVMPETNLDQSRMVAERLCRVIGERPTSLGPEIGNITVTVSIGLAMGNGEEDSALVFDQADQALLESKAEGRNQVTIARSNNGA
jgi:two-component system cell cycle response regulator